MILEQNLIFYKGIDFLSLGLFVELLTDPEKFNEKIDKLRELSLNENNTIKIGSFKFSIHKSNIRPYALRLTYHTPDNDKPIFHFNITRDPHPEKILMVKKGIVRTPDIFMEITGRGLRPQNLNTVNAIVKQLLQFFNIQPYRYIYNRIDYCIDIYDPTKAINFETEVKPIIDSFQRIRKAKYTLNELTEYEYNFKELGELEVKEVYLSDELINYKKGTTGYKEVLAYRTNERDPELLKIYEQHRKEYGIQEELNLKFITRIEVRYWREWLKNNEHSLKNLYYINQFKIEEIITNATGIIYGTGTPNIFIKLAKTPTPIFKYNSQLTNEIIKPVEFNEIRKIDPEIDDELKTFIGYLRRLNKKFSNLIQKDITITETINLIISTMQNRDFYKYLMNMYQKTSDKFYYNLINTFKNIPIQLEKIKDKVNTPVLPMTEKKYKPKLLIDDEIAEIITDFW